MRSLPIVLRCAPELLNRVRYVFDTLFTAAGVPVRYQDTPPAEGPWLWYGPDSLRNEARGAVVPIVHDAQAWRHFEHDRPIDAPTLHEGLHLPFLPLATAAQTSDEIAFDLAANAFYFLSSWSERREAHHEPSTNRQLYSMSVFFRHGVPQDIVDRYLVYLLNKLTKVCEGSRQPGWPAPAWPENKRFALVLSHDVDFLPVRPVDNWIQGAKTVLRHLVRQRDPIDALRAARGWLIAMRNGRDPYGCVPEIIAQEQALGVRSSFQVAVGHRHANDVNYFIEDEVVADYLRVIPRTGFDLCLHGSYRSSENPQWYIEEVELLAHRLARPRGSRQHFLSFDYDRLFSAQESAGIRYDMSMGYPDVPGARAGFSYPYFPYNLDQDRPYRVLQIGLFLMDVTLRGYLRLRASQARATITETLTDLQRKGGCASAVWHPIVFGGARDPGYDSLYYEMIETVKRLDGLATDGATIDHHWRARARAYPSFSFA